MDNLPNEDDKEFLETLEDKLQAAVVSADEQQVAEIVESISSHEALRQASLMHADDRDQLISIMSPEAAAELIVSFTSICGAPARKPSSTSCGQSEILSAISCCARSKSNATSTVRPNCSRIIRSNVAAS